MSRTLNALARLSWASTSKISDIPSTITELTRNPSSSDVNTRNFKFPLSDSTLSSAYDDDAQLMAKVVANDKKSGSTILYLIFGSILIAPRRVWADDLDLPKRISRW